MQLVNARVRSRRSVAADLGEEDPDAEMTRIVEEARRLSALVEADGHGEEDPADRAEDPESQGSPREDEAPERAEEEPDGEERGRQGA